MVVYAVRQVAPGRQVRRQVGRVAHHRRAQERQPLRGASYTAWATCRIPCATPAAPVTPGLCGLMPGISLHSRCTATHRIAQSSPYRTESTNAMLARDGCFGGFVATCHRPRLPMSRTPGPLACRTTSPYPQVWPIMHTQLVSKGLRSVTPEEVGAHCMPASDSNCACRCTALDST